ncbi:flagellar protein FlaG [Vibrio cholerae]|nr:flagellar protein FlaG [Vibrio cholerae]EGR0158984.1 flagellar protein FlaG [Vibrio cholerae]EGR0520461.1 flagellar protein FlaG [Vibrio cholerae]EHD7128559.1 flagellar protein FlaG [Vibrio cholerae]EKC3493457.1 flagellar protein FlaG [Vibrio cholerae]
MEIPSYASNIQPHGSQSGTKIASENDNAKSVSLSGDNSRSVSRTDKLSEHFSEQVRARQQESAETAMAQAKQRQRLNEEQLAKMVEQMNEFVKSINKGLSFRLDRESGREVVTIYEASTGDIIRQIPEEEMLEVLRRLAREQDHRSGLLMAKV